MPPAAPPVLPKGGGAIAAPAPPLLTPLKNIDLRKIVDTTDFLVHKLFDLRKIFEGLLFDLRKIFS